MKTTALVTTTLVICLGIYDLVVVLLGGGTDISVSRFLVNAVFTSPFIVFMVGFVCGHLWGRMKAVSCDKCGSIFDQGKKDV